MKQIISLLSISAIALMALSSCQKENEMLQEKPSPKTAIMTVNAGSSTTKTVVAEIASNNYSLSWTTGDAIAAYEVSSVASVATVQPKVASSPLAADADEATFTMDFSANEGECDFSYIFVYPAANYNNVGSDYLATIPAVQTFKSASFDPDADLLISKPLAAQATRPTSVEAQFERIGATVVMNIKAPSTSETIRAIYFSTTEGNIAGSVAVDPLAGTFERSISANQASEIELIPATSTTYTGTIPVWFRMGAIDLSDNFRVVVKTDSKTYSKTVDLASKSKTIKFENSGLTKFNVDMTSASTINIELTGENMAAMEGANGYGNVKIFESGDFKWVSNGSKQSDNSRFIQLRTDGTPYLELPIVPGTIQSVVFSVTSSNAASEGAEATTSILSFHGTNSGSAIVSSSGESTKSITLKPTADTYRNGFIHSSGSLRIWNVNVYYYPNAASVSSIAITTDPTVTTFAKDASVSFDGKVTATFSDGTTADVTSKISLTADTSTAGSKKATISYGGKTVQYDITVVSKTTVYTFTPVKSTSNTSYTTYNDVKIGGITWNAPGNQNFEGSWRIGGAKGTNVARNLTSKTDMSGDVDEIVIATNGISNANLTINSVTVTAYPTASDLSAGTNGVAFTTSDSFTFSASTAKSLTFTRSGSDNLTNYRYKIVITYTHNKSSNYGLDITGMTFYKN